MAEKRVTLAEARTILAQAMSGVLEPFSDEFKTACRIALSYIPTGAVRKPANIMVCSDCGTVIAKKDDGLFDIYDCSWPCPGCGRLWLSSHGWQEMGNLLIPHGTV